MNFYKHKLIGFFCSYTPLVLIDAAGFIPYRILPLGDFSERAGMILHDNVCPHVKKILDRALSDKIPELFGVVFMNSCDTMRRLFDAWRIVRPKDRAILIDLPPTRAESSVDYFRSELLRFAEILEDWSNCELTADKIENSIKRYQKLSSAIFRLNESLRRGTLKGGSERMQEIYNKSVTLPIDDVLTLIEQEILAYPEALIEQNDSVPIYLLGNVLADPRAFAIFESCGARVVGDDLCTGYRMHAPVEITGSGDVFAGLARGLLSKQACARTFDPKEPGSIAKEVVERVKKSGARGVIIHVMKFCDPYLARIPYINEALKRAGLPVLVLDADCSLSSIGQFRTRIEAFIEVLK